MIAAAALIPISSHDKGAVRLRYACVYAPHGAMRTNHCFRNASDDAASNMCQALEQGIRGAGGGRGGRAHGPFTRVSARGGEPVRAGRVQ